MQLFRLSSKVGGGNQNASNCAEEVLGACIRNSYSAQLFSCSAAVPPPLEPPALDGPVALCSAISSFGGGRVVSAQFFSSRLLEVAEFDPNDTLSAHTRRIVWFADLSKEIVAMTFSDGGNVLAVVCADLTVCIASTRAVLFDSNDPSSGGDGDVPASRRLASLTSLAERTGASQESCALSLFSSTSLFDQLGLDSSRLSLEAPTCCAWWCPAAIVIHRSLKTLQLNERDSTAANVSDPDTYCDGCYLLIGHASGRLTIFDVSRSTRHVIWSAVIDPGRAIRSISLFSDIATLSSLGLWSLPSATSDRPASNSVRDSDELPLDTLASGQFPAHIAIPECSLLIQTERNYLRLTLERACSSPFKERRVAAELAIAISSLTEVHEDGVREKSHGVMSSHSGGLPSWVADLPEPKWTDTILDVTGEAAVAFLKQREHDSSVLSGDSVGAGSASPARRTTSSRGFDSFNPI